MSQTVERVAFIGDVGGHFDAFTRTLAYVGVDVDTATLPSGLTVVQVGDLVHKGSEGDACVALAARLLDRNGGRYVQLVGNHEAHYLGGPDVTGRTGVRPVSEETRRLLTDWWCDGIVRAACAVETPLGEVLVTHGGLSVGFYTEMGSPATAWEAAAALEAIRGDVALLFRPGALMTGVVDTAAGIICPRVGPEVYGPWLERGSMPFSQIHGHETLWWWCGDGWHDDVPERVRHAAVVDRVSRQAWLDVGDERLWGIDPVFGVAPPAYVPVPLVLPGRVSC